MVCGKFERLSVGDFVLCPLRPSDHSKASTVLHGQENPPTSNLGVIAEDEERIIEQADKARQRKDEMARGQHGGLDEENDVISMPMGLTKRDVEILSELYVQPSLL